MLVNESRDKEIMMMSGGFDLANLYLNSFGQDSRIRSNKHRTQDAFTK